MIALLRQLVQSYEGPYVKLEAFVRIIELTAKPMEIL